MDLAGRVAAVTGAGSGIGRALAGELVARGAHVALADVDAEGLALTAAACEGRGVKVTTDVVDVADGDAVRAWADRVVAEHGAVHLVVNNAGVALGATVEHTSAQDLRWLMGVNFWGVVHGTTAFLPHLRRADRGHVVNVSSVFGLVSVPSQGAYNASKFAVRGYTDALRLELELDGGNVSATTVHPGGVRTAIAARARVDPSVRGLSPERDHAREFERVARTSPEAAARRILDGVERDRARVLIGPDAVLFDLVSRLPPSWYRRAVVAGARRLRR